MKKMRKYPYLTSKNAKSTNTDCSDETDKKTKIKGLKEFFIKRKFSNSQILDKI